MLYLYINKKYNMIVKKFKDFNESEINENNTKFGSPYYFGYTEVTKLDLSKIECGLDLVGHSKNDIIDLTKYGKDVG